MLMGKRSSYQRRKNDFYPTPYEAILPLLPHLNNKVIFDEPCAGKRDLVKHLERHGHECARASDITDKYPLDAFKLSRSGASMFITNPPWSRQVLLPLIYHLIELKPTWLLLDGNFLFNKSSADVLKYCHKVVAVGRVKWIPDSPYTSKDNAMWAFFKQYQSSTVFCPRILQ